MLGKIFLAAGVIFVAFQLHSCGFDEDAFAEKVLSFKAEAENSKQDFYLKHIAETAGTDISYLYDRHDKVGMGDQTKLERALSGTGSDCTETFQKTKVPYVLTVSIDCRASTQKRPPRQ